MCAISAWNLTRTKRRDLVERKQLPLVAMSTNALMERDGSDNLFIREIDRVRLNRCIKLCIIIFNLGMSFI